MGRTKREAVAAVWRGRIGRQIKSGLSVAEFCRRQKIAPATFYAWRSRLGKSERLGRPTRGQGCDRLNAEQVQHEHNLHSGNPITFVELSPATWSTGGVRISLPGGAVVALPRDASTDVIAVAIRAAMPTREADAC